MLKKGLVLLLTTYLFLLIIPTPYAKAIAPASAAEPANTSELQPAAAALLPVFQYLDTGIVTVQYDVKPDVKTKLLIQKDEEQRFYDLQPGQTSEAFPLQLGDGDYKLNILENLTDNQYKVVLRDSYSLELANPLEVYLGSVQNVLWDESMPFVAIARDLTKDAATDLEKVSILYQFVIENLEYDEAKANNPPANYLPDLTQIYQQSIGICYDYAALFAAMLRSIDIPTKLVMGDSAFVEQYHAWNEVYLQKTGEWVTIDTTVDATWLRTNSPFEMIKNAEDYSVKYYY